MQILPSRKSIYFIAAIIGLAGCASNPTSDSSALVQQASQAMASGSNEKAIDLLSQATKSNPTDADAWARLAQAYFDTKDYPRAITAASEALARQPNQQEARGIQFVASMRLAMSTLADIRKTNQLNGNNRAEAEQVVKSLRETLGETILLPGNRPRETRAETKDDKPASGASSPTANGTNAAEATAAKPTRKKPRGKGGKASSATENTASTPATQAKPASQPTPTSAPAKSNGNPFDALR